MQAESLRLLDASTSAINQMITDLWPDLDLFAAERTGIGWKQVEKHLRRRSGHGSRQERCEMEQPGRILRAQATRKQVFQPFLPLPCPLRRSRCFSTCFQAIPVRSAANRSR